MILLESIQTEEESWGSIFLLKNCKRCSLRLKWSVFFRNEVPTKVASYFLYSNIMFFHNFWVWNCFVIALLTEKASVEGCIPIYLLFFFVGKRGKIKNIREKLQSVKRIKAPLHKVRVNSTWLLVIISTEAQVDINKLLKLLRLIYWWTTFLIGAAKLLPFMQVPAGKLIQYEPSCTVIWPMNIS